MKTAATSSRSAVSPCHERTFSLLILRRLCSKFTVVPGDEPREEPRDEPREEPRDEPGDEARDEPRDEPRDEARDEARDEPRDEASTTAQFTAACGYDLSPHNWKKTA